MSMIQFGEPSPSSARIKVIGVGGAGGNAINAMVRAGVEGVEFIAVNTDKQDLDINLAPKKIQIGKTVTKGLGAGSNPDQGEKAVEEDREEIIDAVSDADMVFITAGMGGGTGTGAAPVISEIAKSSGALTVAIVTRPFKFEGNPRSDKASRGIERLREKVDTLIIIPNERLFAITEKRITILNAFSVADDVLLQATRGISDIITRVGHINLDFADVRAIMSDTGDALMGTGVSTGTERATVAAQQAISNTLLEGVSIDGAMGVLVNVTASSDIGLHEMDQAVSIVQEQAGSEANVIVGLVIDDNMGEEFRVTVIATGFDSDSRKLRQLNTTLADSHMKLSKPREIAPEKVREVEPVFKPVQAEPEPLFKEPDVMVTESISEVEPISVKKVETPKDEKNPAQIHLDLNEAEKPLEEKIVPKIKQDIDLNEQFEEIKQRKSHERRSSLKGSITDIEVPTFLRRTMD